MIVPSRIQSHSDLTENTAVRRRPEMDVRTAETGDDGRTSLQLDLGDTGSYAAPFGL